MRSLLCITMTTEKSIELENLEIISRLDEHTKFLEVLRVSQDGWAKVLSRMAIDHDDMVKALKARKIVAHIPQHLKPNK